MKRWAELSNSQKNMYLEFHCPKRKNIHVIPSNNTEIHFDKYTPTDLQSQSVMLYDPPDTFMKVSGLNKNLTIGQRNSIIDWLEENNPYQENAVYN